MPQPNKGSAASSAPTQEPLTDKSGAKSSDPSVHFGAPGGAGTKGK